MERTRWSGYRPLLALALIVALLMPAPALSDVPVGPPPAGGTGMLVENVGQFDAAARFRWVGAGGALWLTQDALWLSAMGDDDGAHLKLHFPGANPRARLEPFGRHDATVSYLLGSDPSAWRASVPAWTGVRYVDLFPGADLEITSAADGWKWRMVLRPGASLDPSTLRLRVDGADELALAGSAVDAHAATLALRLPLLELVTPAALATSPPSTRSVPVPYGAGLEIVAPFTPSEYTQNTPSSSSNHLHYATFLGASDRDEVTAVTLDDQGASYLAGYTWSLDFPTTPGAFDPYHAGGQRDAFVAKLNPAGTELVYVTFLGGGGQDLALALDVDAAGRAHITGETGSEDWPTTPGAYATAFGGWFDVFVAALSPQGDALAYSTYLGASGGERGRGVSVGYDGSVYVAGETGSLSFPVTADALQPTHAGGEDPLPLDAFLARLGPDGATLTYATFLGGAAQDGAHGLAVDAQGNAYLAGYTQSPDLPVTPGAVGAQHAGPVGGNDGFVASVRPNGALAYATYLGGSNREEVLAITVDGSGSAYVAGQTFSPDFPTTAGAYDTEHSGSVDAFVARLTPAGDLAFSTLYGGSDWDQGAGIVVGQSGLVYLGGYTQSLDLPTTLGAFGVSFRGGADAFLAVLGHDGANLLYGSYVGGSDWDQAASVALDAAGHAYLAGSTESPDFPISPVAPITAHSGDRDGFLLILRPTGPGLQPPTRQLFLPMVGQSAAP